MLDRIEGNGVRVVIVEDASRFARDLMTQEVGILSLAKSAEETAAHRGGFFMPADRHDGRAPRLIEAAIAQ